MRTHHGQNFHFITYVLCSRQLWVELNSSIFEGTTSTGQGTSYSLKISSLTALTLLQVFTWLSNPINSYLA